MMEVIYEDNHIIAVNKRPGEIVQGDKTGDEPLMETVRRYIKEKGPVVRWRAHSRLLFANWISRVVAPARNSR